jgi:two-component system, NarL family, nitrate/nitrite response regulator NarL
LASEGLSNKEIGRRLNITDGTIKVHLHHIFRKLDVSNRTALATLVHIPK